MLKFSIATGFFFLLSACQATTHEGSLLKADQADGYPLDSRVFDLASEGNPNKATGAYFSLAVPFEPVDALKSEIEARTGMHLKDRGEAHVTLLTPLEVRVLKSRLNGQQILDAIENNSLQSETLNFACVGLGAKVQAGKTMRTYFLVTHSAGLVQRRRNLEAAFRAAGGSPQGFDAEHFYPHVTIGFTHNDLHEQDGVIKDEQSCVAPVVVVP